MTPSPSRRWVAECSIDPEPDPGAHPPQRRPREIKGELRAPTHPILVAVAEQVLRAYPWALPFPNGAFDQITCRNALEFVVDDAAFIAEMARVLRPGGRLVLTVPATGPLAGFDAMNLYKYLCDVSGRGPRLAEPRELGWRRHYAVGDIAHLVEADFTIMTQRHHRLIVTELAHLVALIWHRWLGVDRAGYAFARYRVERIAVHEDGIGSAVGFMLSLVLERR